MTPGRYQWTVFSVDLDPVVGSEQAGRRPVLIVSRESANAVLPVLTVVPLTGRKPNRRIYPNEALLPKGAAGLRGDSVAMAHQLRTLSKQRLGDPLGRLNDPDLRRAVRAAIQIQLDLV
ncbi:MAG: type II toxin-antitoxin system PemK/MazF family toxin [Thermoanaerobaculales bacterium]|nr:type II toxin-antitoxin system PemK/MazF family toxin [Thermoanaerobaculales bacterium]